MTLKTRNENNNEIGERTSSLYFNSYAMIRIWINHELRINERNKLPMRIDVMPRFGASTRKYGGGCAFPDVHARVSNKTGKSPHHGSLRYTRFASLRRMSPKIVFP